MRTLYLRFLQTLTRAAVRCPALRPRVFWRIEALRARIAQADPPIELETRFDDGVRVRVSLSSHIEAQLFWQGFQEADESAIAWLKRLLPEDGVFFDIGANIGSFSLVGAKRAVTGVVHAFEPSSYHLERLRYNLGLNGFKNVRINPFALSDASGEAVLHLPVARCGMSNSGTASLFELESPGVNLHRETVRTMRLDDYCKDQACHRIDVVKIDVEGAELKVLAGGKDILGRMRPAVIQEMDMDNLTRAESSAEELLAFWRSLGYRIEKIQAVDTLSPVTRVEDLDAHQNILCRPSDSASGRFR